MGAAAAHPPARVEAVAAAWNHSESLELTTVCARNVLNAMSLITSALALTTETPWTLTMLVPMEMLTPVMQLVTVIPAMLLPRMLKDAMGSRTVTPHLARLATGTGGPWRRRFVECKGHVYIGSNGLQRIGCVAGVIRVIGLEGPLCRVRSVAPMPIGHSAARNPVASMRFSVVLPIRVIIPLGMM